MNVQCCCNYGAAVKGEWPEFQCFKCPVHTEPLMASEKDLCHRHRAPTPSASLRRDRRRRRRR